jgi:hypothetical protein
VGSDILQWLLKKRRLDDEAIREFLVADTDSESGIEGSEVEDELDDSEDERRRRRQQLQLQQQQQQQQQQVSLSTRSCNKWWWITTLGTASRKEHCCPSFYRASKRCEKQ